jgi:hypothetical protein
MTDQSIDHDTERILKKYRKGYMHWQILSLSIFIFKALVNNCEKTNRQFYVFLQRVVFIFVDIIEQ